MGLKVLWGFSSLSAASYFMGWYFLLWICIQGKRWLLYFFSFFYEISQCRKVCLTKNFQNEGGGSMYHKIKKNMLLLSTCEAQLYLNFLLCAWGRISIFHCLILIIWLWSLAFLPSFWEGNKQASMKSSSKYLCGLQQLLLFQNALVVPLCYCNCKLALMWWGKLYSTKTVTYPVVPILDPFLAKLMFTSGICQWRLFLSTFVFEFSGLKVNVSFSVKCCE